MLSINTNLKLSKAQYYQEVYPKKIIVLHHTVSGKGIEGDVSWWETDPQKVGTPFIIDRAGNIHQVFDEKYWIHHLGVTTKTLNKYGSSVSNTKLNQLSIGIELDSWGGLIQKDGKWYNYNGKIEIPTDNVQIYPGGYRGVIGYEKYTEEQINALRELLIYLSEKHNIKLHYFKEMFQTNDKALKGYHGIWSHTSYREDKNDCHPQPELIEMLSNLPK